MIREVRALKKSGEELDCEVAISELVAPAGSRRLFTVVIHDLTERKQVEKEKEKEAQVLAERAEQLERELHSLERLSTPKTATTAQMLGLMPLHQGAPNIFDEMLQRYGDLIELALEQQAYRVEHDISGNLRSIAEELGYLKAGPRDVVELHSSALKRKTNAASHAKAQAYVEEGRVMVLELMGHLVSHYRTCSVGTAAVKTREKPGRKRRTLSVNNENKYPVAKGG